MLLKNKCGTTFFILFIISWSVPSFCQIQTDSTDYKIGLNVSGRRISGTFNQLVARGAINADFQNRNWHLENRLSYQYNKTNGRLIEDNWYNLLTFSWFINGHKRLYPGLFYHYDNNLMFRVNRRHRVGIGVGSILDKEDMKLHIVAGLAYENATFNGDTFVNSDFDFEERQNGLFVFRIENGFAFAQNKINLSYRFFYMQSLKEGLDYDFWITPKVSFKVIKGLSLNITYDYRFENVHLESLSNYNDIILFGINWTIKN